MNFLLEQQWMIFISLEVLSIGLLIAFGILRYALDRQKTSTLMLLFFMFCIVLEAALAFAIYTETKEISSFHIVIGIFILYACTFGIHDFRKLDRWMRQKIGKWRNVNLLTEKDDAILQKQKDPKYVAKKYRRSSLVHLVIFGIVQSILVINGTNSFEELKMYATDLSWLDEGSYKHSPYGSELAYSIGIIWTIVFIADFLYSWSYTIFPSTSKK